MGILEAVGAAVVAFSAFFGAGLAADNAFLRNQLEITQTQLAAQKTEIEQLKAQSEARDQRILHFEAEVAGLNAKLAQKDQTIAGLTQDKATLETRNQELGKSNQDFVGANKDWAEAFAREKKWADDAQDKLAIKDRKIADLVALNERAMESVHRSLLLGREVTTLRKEVGTLKGQLKATQDALKREKDGRATDNTTLSGKLGTAKSDAETMQQSLDKTRADLETAKTKVLIFAGVALLLLVAATILLIRGSRSTPTRDPDDAPGTQ